MCEGVPFNMSHNMNDYPPKTENETLKCWLPTGISSSKCQIPSSMLVFGGVAACEPRPMELSKLSGVRI